MAEELGEVNERVEETRERERDEGGGYRGGREKLRPMHLSHGWQGVAHHRRESINWRVSLASERVNKQTHQQRGCHLFVKSLGGVKKSSHRRREALPSDSLPADVKAYHPGELRNALCAHDGTAKHFQKLADLNH